MGIRGLLLQKKEYLENCSKLMKKDLKPGEKDSLVVLKAKYLDR